MWFFQPPYEGEFKFQTQPISPTFPDTSNIALDPRECLFKIPETKRVLASEYRRGNLPFILNSFQWCLLVYGNMVGTSRNHFLLKFHYVPSLDGTWKQTLVSSKKNTKILRLTSNPQVRVSFIVRKGLKIPFPLSMIAHKRSKGPQLNIS